jgi:hypothetical protein
MLFAPRLCSSRPWVYQMMSSPLVWTRRGRLSASGASDLLWSACQASRNNLAAGALPGFPPSLIVQVKALACELPQRLGMPLSRMAIADIKRHVIEQGLVWPKLAGPLSGAGSAPMPFVLGNNGVGSSHVILSSLSKQGVSSIFMNALGRPTTAIGRVCHLRR